MLKKNHFKKGHLLLVTAEGRMTKRFKMEVEDELLELHTATTTAEAMEKLSEYPIDVLVTDMDTQDSMRFLARVQLKHPEIYGIVVTDGHDREMVRHIIQRKLAKRFVTKPVKTAFIKRQAPAVIEERQKREFNSIIEEKGHIHLLPSSRKVLPSLRSMAQDDNSTLGVLSDVLQNDLAISTAVLHAFYTADDINMIDLTQDMLDTDEQKEAYQSGEWEEKDEIFDVLDELFYVTKNIEIEKGANDPRKEVIVQKRKTSSITHALLQMGIERLRTVLDSMEFIENYEEEKYYHFRKMSIKSVLIRRFTPVVHRALYYNPVSRRVDLPLYFIDIGRLFQFAHMPDIFEEIIKYMKAHTNLGFYTAELELGLEGRTHVDIGTILMEKWGFPPLYSLLCRHHHVPQNAKQNLKTLLAAVAYTDAFIEFLIKMSQNKEIDLTKFKYYKKFPLYDLKVMKKKMLNFIAKNEWI